MTLVGMKNIVLDEKSAPNKIAKNDLWKMMLSSQFHIVSHKVQETQLYLSNNLEDIAKENLVGQCTTGHSCKRSSKMKLMKLIEFAFRQK